MKIVVNLALSLAMLAACLWLVWPSDGQLAELERALRALELSRFWPYLAGYIGLLAVTHFCRGYRWNNLLRPIGAELPVPRLLAISSVGFMAILALPARLGEFVRPALIRRKGEVSASAALGTIAVERVVDGLLVSLFVFCAFFAMRGPDAPGWMMPTAYAALGVFTAATVFLAFALRWPHRTVHTAVSLTLAPRIAPKLAQKLDEKIHSLISGFFVLKDMANLRRFVAWSVGYWLANGLGMWLLARGFGLDLSIVGAYATMGLIAVGITLPNSPGLVGQFQWFTLLGLMLYMPEQAARTSGLAYAIVLHAIQVVWYVGVGSFALASKHVSFAEVWASRHDADDAEGAAGSSRTDAQEA